MQPLQRNYALTEDRIQSMIQNNSLKSLYDLSQVTKLENKDDLNGKEQAKLNKFKESKPLYEKIIEILNNNTSNEIYDNLLSFETLLYDLLGGIITDSKQLKNLVDKISDGLSVMDKTAKIQKDKKGNIKYDKTTKDIEIVPYNIDIQDYMEKEVLPHVPDAKAFFEENLNRKKPTIKTGAEIPFTRMFYKYKHPRSSEEIVKEIKYNETSLNETLNKLFEDD